MSRIATGKKQQLYRKYGKEQTVGCYFVLWNAINYAGEKWVRDSFESVNDFSDEKTILSDYSSDDGTPELAKECGLRVINVPKDGKMLFNSAKCQNAALYYAKSNFMLDLQIHYNYPKIMEEYCKFWLSRNINNIDKKVLSLRGKYFKPDGSFEKYATGPWLIYRPYWLHVRGFDERCGYPWGAGPYGLIMTRIYWGLEVEEEYIGIVHKQHYKMRDNYRKKVFGVPNPNYNPDKTRAESSKLARDNIKDFNKVHNSYW